MRVVILIAVCWCLVWVVFIYTGLGNRPVGSVNIPVHYANGALVVDGELVARGYDGAQGVTTMHIRNRNGAYVVVVDKNLKVLSAEKENRQ